MKKNFYSKTDLLCLLKTTMKSSPPRTSEFLSLSQREHFKSIIKYDSLHNSERESIIHAIS